MPGALHRLDVHPGAVGEHGRIHRDVAHRRGTAGGRAGANGVRSGAAHQGPGEGHGVAGGEQQIAGAVAVAVHGHQPVGPLHRGHPGAILHDLLHSAVGDGVRQLRGHHAAHAIGIGVGVGDGAGHALLHHPLGALGQGVVHHPAAAVAHRQLHRPLAGHLRPEIDGWLIPRQVDEHHLILGGLHMQPVEQMVHRFAAGLHGAGLLLAGHGDVVTMLQQQLGLLGVVVHPGLQNAEAHAPAGTAGDDLRSAVCGKHHIHPPRLHRVGHTAHRHHAQHGHRHHDQQQHPAHPPVLPHGHGGNGPPDSVFHVFHMPSQEVDFRHVYRFVTFVTFLKYGRSIALIPTFVKFYAISRISFTTKPPFLLHMIRPGQLSIGKFGYKKLRIETKSDR